MRTCKLRTCKLESYCFVPLLPLPRLQQRNLQCSCTSSSATMQRTAQFVSKQHCLPWALAPTEFVGSFGLSSSPWSQCLCALILLVYVTSSMSDISQLFTLKLRSCMGCPIGELLMPGCHIMSNISEMYVTSSCK